MLRPTLHSFHYICCTPHCYLLTRSVAHDTSFFLLDTAMHHAPHILTSLLYMPLYCTHHYTGSTNLLHTRLSPHSWSSSHLNILHYRTSNQQSTLCTLFFTFWIHSLVHRSQINKWCTLTFWSMDLFNFLYIDHVSSDKHFTIVLHNSRLGITLYTTT